MNTVTKLVIAVIIIYMILITIILGKVSDLERSNAIQRAYINGQIYNRLDKLEGLKCE